MSARKRIILFRVLVNHITKMLLAEEDHLVQTFHFYGLDKSLRKSIRLPRALHPMGVMGRDGFGLSIHFIPYANRKWSW